MSNESSIQWTTDDETRSEFTVGTHAGRIVSVRSEPPKNPNDDKGQPKANNLVWRIVGQDSVTGETCYVTSWNPLKPKSMGMKTNGEWLRALGIDPAQGIALSPTDKPGVSEITELANLAVTFTTEVEARDGKSNTRLTGVLPG